MKAPATHSLSGIRRSIQKAGIFCVTLLLATALLPSALQAQNADKLPPFGITLSNGRYFGAADLPKGKPVVLIYFAPDCDHCHTLMNEFFKKAGEFNTATVVMVTFKPLSDVVAFERAYQTAKYPHILVGTEGTANYLRLFYKLQSTPFTALYNREGKLVSSYRKDTPLDALLQQLKKM